MILASLISLAGCSTADEFASRLFVKAGPPQVCQPDPSIAARCRPWPAPAPVAADPVEAWMAWLGEVRQAHDSCQAAVEEMAKACPGDRAVK